MSEVNVPKTFSEVVRSCRHLYQMDPVLHAMIERRIRDAYPDFILKCEDERHRIFYQEQAFRTGFNLRDFVVYNIAKNLHVVGEAIIYGSKQLVRNSVFDKHMWVWDKLVTLSAENVEIKKLPLENRHIHYLRPDTAFDLFKELLPRLESPLVKMIENKQLIPLDSELVSSMQHLQDRMSIRGLPSYDFAKVMIDSAAGIGFQNPDDYDSDAYKMDRLADQKAMGSWMIHNFFMPLARWNGLDYLPEIAWQNEPQPAARA